jgi:hypothetical protein
MTSTGVDGRLPLALAKPRTTSALTTFFLGLIPRRGLGEQAEVV